jgi:hypothetical protein
MILGDDRVTPDLRVTQYLGSQGLSRARDTKLGRGVAVKVPPETLAEDPEPIARFEREASRGLLSYYRS